MRWMVMVGVLAMAVGCAGPVHTLPAPNLTPEEIAARDAASARALEHAQAETTRRLARQRMIDRVMGRPPADWTAATRQEAEAAVTTTGRQREAEVAEFQRALRVEVETVHQERQYAGRTSGAGNARDDAYCQSLASEIAIAGANDGELLLGILFGMRPSRERMHYNSCMRSFARTRAYLAP